MMNNLDFEKIEMQFNTALDEKENNKSLVETAINENHLIAKFDSIEKKKEHISSIEDLHKYEKDLNSFFKEVYEIITAPGVLKFVDWLFEMDSKNSLNNNIKSPISRLLIDKYSEFDQELKSILTNKEVIEPNNSLFEDMKKSVRLNIVKRVDSLSQQNNTDFEQDFQLFLNDLKTLFNKLSEISAINYTSVKDFYTKNLIDKENEGYEAQVDADSDYCYDLIKQIIEKKDNLTTNQELISLTTISDTILNQINDINSSVSLLKSLNLSENTDPIITDLYNKFEQSLSFHSKSNISEQLQEYIENTWNSILDAYSLHLNFYKNNTKEKVEKLESRKSEWNNHSDLNGPIEQYLITIKNIIEKNPINEIQGNDISKIKTSFIKSEKSIESLTSENPKDSIVGYFNNKVEEFRTKKIPILSRLGTNQESIEEIKSSLEIIKSFLKSIAQATDNILDVLNEDFLDGIIGTYKHISEKFSSAIENTEIKNDIAFINSIQEEGIILNYEELTADMQRFKRLLEYDLINIKLTKNI